MRAQQHQAGREADDRRHDRRQQQARDRLGPDAVMGQHSDRIGAGAEEGGMAEGDDAGIAEHEVEREREQDRDQQLGAEAEIVRKGEVAGNGEEPGERLPEPQPVAFGQRKRRGVLDRSRGHRGHVVFFPNRPCGRHSSSRMVRAKMNSVPPLGR